MRFTFLALSLAAIVIVAPALWAQGQGSGGGTPGGRGGGGQPGGGGAGGGRNGGSSSDVPQPGGDNSRSPFPEIQRPIFVNGQVMMDNGEPPPEPVAIERVCNGQRMIEGNTDAKGRFSLQLGRGFGVFQDASTSSFGNVIPGNAGVFGGGGSPNGGGLSEQDLLSCELQAALPGYISTIVQLAGRRMMDDPNIGTIFLRRLADVQGFTFSATTALAPKDAAKAYDRGHKELHKKDLDEKKMKKAQEELEKAVAIYPRFAAAWYDLGVLHVVRQEKEQAFDAFSRSVEADSKFISPYLQIATLHAEANDWKALAETSAEVTRLNPIHYPQAYFFNAVANFNLKKYDEAEEAAREAVRLDSDHRFPRAGYVLGLLEANRADNEDAAQHLRGYLEVIGDSPEAETVKKQLAQIEQALSQAEAPADQAGAPAEK